MKHLIIATILLSRLIACENISGVFNTAEENNAKNSIDADIPARDMSITSENSYSDLFLDSAIVEHYIRTESVGDSAAQSLRNFYKARNYQFAWFNSEGFTEQGRGFWSLYDYTNKEGEAGATLQDEDLKRGMDTLTEKDSLIVNTADSAFFKTELSISRQFLAFAAREKEQHQVFADPYHFVPVKKVDPLKWADSVLRLQKTRDSASSGNAMGTTKPYDLLMDQLGKYYEAEQKGGWPSVPYIGKNVKKGASLPVVASIKKRLAQTGDFTITDSSQIFDDSLALAVRSFKLRHGLDSSEYINDSLIQVLNVPAARRIEQIIVNMNRMQWMPVSDRNSVIEVNIPDFMLQVYEGGSKALEMKVVVGKEGSSTMMFSGDLNQVVFSPYWNIPESIVKTEILPAMKTNSNYLRQHNMEIMKKNDSVPTIRQLPGGDNSLGKVKFLFPNTFDIFFHDTPAKDLFQRDQRAFSHGCIRLEDAGKLAAYLLRNDKGWTPEKVREAMNGKKEQWVKLTTPVPVVITYFTAWVDGDGKLNFRNDVYGHDLKTSNRMFATTALQHNDGPASDTMPPNTGKPDTLNKRA